MKHRWGLPATIDGRPDDSVLDGAPKECFCSVMYCLRCKTVFCEHCLGPDMFDLECDGEESKVA